MTSSSDHNQADLPLYLRGAARNYNTLVSDARVSIRNYQHEDALGYCAAGLAIPRLRPGQKATLLCLRAEVLENLARFTEAIETLSPYEREEKREKISWDQRIQVLLRLASAHGGTPDLPRAISYGKQALAMASEDGDAGSVAACHLALGTLYRRIGETRFAHDHFLQARTKSLGHKDPVSLAQAWNGLGMVSLTEGDWDAGQAAFSHGREALEGVDAPLLQGTLDINLAVLIALQGRLRESVALFEQALAVLVRARHPRLIVSARSNLGCALLRLGELARARQTLEQALVEARGCEALVVAANTLESLGELFCIQGNFAEAETVFGESLQILGEIRIGFNLAQSQLTRGRCHMLADNAEKALACFLASEEISERLGDPRGLAEARLWLVEAYLKTGAEEQAQSMFARLRPQVERMGNVPLLGRLRELAGALEMNAGAWTQAIRHLEQAASIREMTGEIYRLGTTCYHLGVAQARAGRSGLARDALTRAHDLFQALSAAPMLARTVTELAQINAVETGAGERPAAETVITAALTRLIEANASPELLLHELTHVLHDDLAVAPVIIFRQTPGKNMIPLAWRGCHAEEARLAGEGKQTAPPAEFHYLLNNEDEQWLLWLGRRGETLPAPLLRLLALQFETCLDRVRWRPRHGPAPMPGPAPA
ncbi:MAG: tetratricopeptide repeat protein, partial [Blastocatellia bacterium]